MTGYHLYLRLLRYVRPYWWAFALAVVGMVIVAAGDLIMAMLVIPIVQTFQSNDPVRAQWLPVAVIGVFLFRGIGSYISEYGMAYTGHRVVFDLRRELTDKLLKLPTPYYDVTPSGVVQSKLTFDAHQLAQAASGTITTAIRSTLTIAASFGWLMWINWRLTLMTFFVLPIVAVVIRYFSRRLRRIARDVQSRTGSMTHVLEEMIGGHRIVRIFGGERYERERAVKAANSLRNSMTKQSSASAASSPREALIDVSMTVRPGETVALVGSSGSGKSSLVNLIPRFYEPTAGRLFIDGHDVTTLTLKSLRAQIALVSQDVMLFDDTVAANIAYGAMSGTPSAAIERAAAAAHALEFIRAMPQGFDTPVGEHGVRLSGGQRQRIAIARAILKDAPILILDEATSALDSESERQVQEALDALMQGRTTLVIAHRLSTIEHAVRIVVLERGRVVEQGTHAELIARGGVYARLHRLQFNAATAVA